MSSSSISFSSDSSSTFIMTSSSSSNSSSKSTSSISTSSTSSSSMSSATSFSSSSTSKSTSSSSSSIDSSSTSSESIGNFSSSSSSSFGGWNKTKPLILGMSAINASGITNKLAQTISLIGNYYSIGKIFCYFYGPYGFSQSFTIHLDVYTCNNDGEPLNIICSKTLDGANINGNGWYSFEVDLYGEVPSNKYLSFVIWQENGDEDNYVLWGHYYADTTTGTKAIFSNDGVIWQYQEGVIRSLKLIGKFEAYDLTEFRIITPPAEQQYIIGELEDGEFDGTKYESEKVVIENPDLIASFVIDSSGSMGWNDRFSNRIDLANTIITRIKDDYPGNVVFDIVKFGSQTSNTNSLTSEMGIGVPAYINVNLASPTRSSFYFRVDGASAAAGDIYENNGYSFVVSDTISSGSLLTCNGIYSSIPFDSGILTLSSGTGDPTIYFNNSTKASMADGVVAYGFKDLEEDDPCNLSDISIFGISYENSLKNWQALSAAGEIELSIGNNGPNFSSSIDFISSENLVLRRPISTKELITKKIINDVSAGISVIDIEDSSVFFLGDYVDFIDKDLASFDHKIVDISSNTITVSPELVFNIGSWNNNGGIIQKSNNSVFLNTITANILFRDIYSTRDIVFFLQTENGLLEYSISPFKEWVSNNVYWMDETAAIPISAFDTYGNPFPDGTKIVLYVGGYPEKKQQQEKEEIVNEVQILSKDIFVGSNKIYVNSTDEYFIGQPIDLMNNSGNIQTVTIVEIGKDLVGTYLAITPVAVYDFFITDGAKIVPHIIVTNVGAISSSNMIYAELSVVDITPIYTKKSLNPSLLKPYDITPTDPNISYDELNLAKDLIRNGVLDIPSISDDEAGYSVIRILPITEDNLKTMKQKSKEADSLLYAFPEKGYTEQQEQNDDMPVDTITTATDITTATTTQYPPSKGEDYNIDTPVYLRNGYAQSGITTFATDFELQESKKYNSYIGDSNSSGRILAKDYIIYPAMIYETETSVGKTVLYKQYFSPVNVNFTPPYFIYNEYKGEKIFFIKEKPEMYYCNSDSRGVPCPENCYYTKEYANGVYASGNGFSIKYTVLNKNQFVVSGKLKIRIYSNTVFDQSSVDEYVKNISSKYNQQLNVKLPDTYKIINGKKNIVQQLTKIDEWRKTVENNQFSVASVNVVKNNNSGKSLGIIDNVMGKLNEMGYKQPKEIQYKSDSTYADIYSNPLEWTKASQYGILQETTIDILDGIAVLEIPSSDISALLLIQASIYFGDNEKYEYINSNVIPVMNPIEISPINMPIMNPIEIEHGIPFQIFAEGGDKTYEIGSFVTWKGEPISDNVIVNYGKKSGTPMLPSASKTDGGWAGGISIGPHSIVKVKCDCCEETDCCHGQYERISISVSYLGYTRKVIRKIEWTGDEEVEDDPDIELYDFYFYIDDCKIPAYADGFSVGKLEADLDDALNQIWINVYSIPSDGRNIDRIMGYEQGPNKSMLPNKISGTTRNDIKIALSQYSWESYVTDIYISGLNQNIGHEQPAPSFPSSYSPWNFSVNVNTKYKYYIDGRISPLTMNGLAVSIYPFHDNLGEFRIIKPKGKFIEPLSISISTEAHGNNFIRNGVFSANVVADVRWKDGIINGKFTKNEGSLDETTIDYPFPIVTFEAGICKQENKYLIPAETETWNYIDTRGDLEGCLVVGDHKDVSLTSYSSVVGLFRTDIYDHISGTHTHSCNVDSNGNGKTEETIFLSGASIVNHYHEITNYASDFSGDPLHQHGLRSVAITRLNPLTNPIVNIAINGYVVYDPTNCDPYNCVVCKIATPKPNKFTDGNRMMFGTLYINGIYGDRRLIMDLIPSTFGAYSARSVTDTDRGIDVVLKAYFSEYIKQDSEGGWIIVPATPIPDGTRVIWDIKCYKPGDTDTSNEVVVMEPGKVRECMLIFVTATLNIEGINESMSVAIYVRSNLFWIPSVYNLLIEPTNDDIYIEDALRKIDTIGTSQIHDAVKFAAQRIIQYQTDNSNWKSAKKAIFLLTDGDENTSEYSINQAIDNVNIIDGECKVPVIPVKLGYSYGSILNKYSLDTCGNVYYMINSSISDIDNIIDDIVTGSYIGVNNGIYSNTIDMLSDNLISGVSINDIYIPENGKALFRYRYGSDSITWSNWSEWHDISIIKEFDKDLKFKCRYLQYQVKLFGNENYESPEINYGLKLGYYKAQTFTVFFQPIDLNINYDQYLSSIHITHKATIPATSFINYGYTQFNSTDINDYSSVTRPWIEPDRHTIILTRYNEKMTTKNYQKYTAINGGWADGANVELYKVNANNLIGELIPSSQYSINNKTGDITFFNIQNKTDIFVICIYFDPVFRLVCNTTNYGPEAATIDHIGVIYNIGKRIPMLNNGNIIHAPINERI